MSIKRILCTALAITLAVSCVLFGGCSTPTVAMQVDDKVYEMGDYLAYMYGTMYTDQTAYMYLYYYGEDAMSQTVTYGEDAEEMTLSEYIVKTTQDNMIRQKAIEELMESYNIEWNAEDLKTIEEEVAELGANQFLDLGFNNERYINMYKAIYLNESSLFTGLYDDGGVKEISDEDERKWFDEHYLSYKIIEFSLVDSQTSKELSEDDIAKIKTQLEGYLDLYNKNGKNGDAFDVAYRQYLTDTETETDTDTKTETENHDHDHDHDHAEEEEEVEEPQTATRNDAIDEDMDEELVKVIKELGKGEIGIKTYQKNGTTKTMALILRMDPEAERGKDEAGNAIDYYADSHDQTLQYMKYEELAEEINAKVKELANTVTVNKSAINAADPKDMI